MSVLNEIITGMERGRALAETTSDPGFRTAERHLSEPAGESGRDDADRDPVNYVALGDNMEYMRWLLDNGYAGKFRCIYIDPPFFTKAKYNAVVDIVDSEGKKHKIRHMAYDDRFERDLEHYIENLTARLILIRDLLASDGTLWVHIDWHSVHYVRLLLDEIFGQKSFVNEIVWKYKSGGTSKKHFSRKHDTLLVYSKSSDYYFNIPEEKSYNRDFKPYRFKGVKEYCDEFGWYTMVKMKDVWSIDMVGRTSAERSGYATQKPLELMKRIIAASSEPGDLVGDLFCGSGPFAIAASQLGRSWICCDSEELAVSMAKKRLDGIKANYLFQVRNDYPVYHDGFSMKRTGSEALENGRQLMTYSLGEFRPDVDSGYIYNKDRAAVESLCVTDPESLIDYIMIDPGDNEVFSAEMTVSSGFDEIKLLSHGKVAFVAVDRFGKEYYFNDK